MTEKYIRGITSNNINERNWNNHHDSAKSPFTVVGRVKINYPVPNMTNDKLSKAFSYTSNSSAIKESPFNASVISNPISTSERLKSSSQSYVTSTYAGRGEDSYSFSNKLSYNHTSPPKAVKFEDSLDTDDNTKHVNYYKQSYHDSPTKFGRDTYGVNGGYHPDSTEDEFEEIDEKVKEGKEILKRLLKSTNTKKNKEVRLPSSNSQLDLEDEVQSFTPIKSPLNSSWNETEEIIARCREDCSMDLPTDSNTHMQDMKELKDPVFMSTRLDASDERMPLKPGFETSSINSVGKRSALKKVKQAEDSQDEKLVEEIKCLKEELSNHEVNSFFEIKSMKEENEKLVGKLYGQISNLNKQKETLEGYIGQLKTSLTKKNDKCFELQEQLHKKLSLIHQLTTTDDKERLNLENEVNILQSRKKTLEEQIGKMEQSLKNQYEEIKELERRFLREKQGNMDILRMKDEEISSLNHKINIITEDNHAKEEELRSEYETQIENAVLSRKNMLHSEMEEMKMSLDNELERQARIHSKHQSEVNHLKSSFETVRAANIKLKQELEASRHQNQNLEKCNLENIKNARDEAELENDLLKKKLIEYERIQKSMALELIEESTKLAVVCGTSPSSSRVSSPDTYVDCNIMSEAMVVFKEHLENFRHYALSLRNESQHQRTEANEESTLTSGNGQTSAKLLRHLQNRVQQLRKENAMLQASSICESCQNEIKSTISDDTENIMAGSSSLEEENIPVEDHQESKLSPITTYDMILPEMYCDTGIMKNVPPAEMAKWEVSYPEYNPVDFTAIQIESETYEETDNSVDLTTIKFNDVDGKVDRRSYFGTYEIIDGIPRNPIGRTGITGCGLLKRWGPNHMIDPIVTRWLSNENGDVVEKDGKPVLEFIAIQETETGEWALPRDVLEIGQDVSPILIRELIDGGGTRVNDEDDTVLKQRIKEVFECGTTIYKGHVEDPRKTDNAWVETTVIHYHDEEGDSVALVPLKDGELRWVTIDCKLNLSSYHKRFIEYVCNAKKSYIEE